MTTAQKTYTLVLTESELDTLYDSISEFSNCTDNEVDLENLSIIENKIYELCQK